MNPRDVIAEDLKAEVSKPSQADVLPIEALRECAEYHEHMGRVCRGSADVTKYNIKHHLIKRENQVWHEQDMAFQTKQAEKHQCFADSLRATIAHLQREPVSFRGLVEIMGPDNKVHYRRPYPDPMITEAMTTKGYWIRGADSV